VHSLNTLSTRANAIKYVTRHIDCIVAPLYRSIIGLFLLGLSFLSLGKFLLTSVSYYFSVPSNSAAADKEGSLRTCYSSNVQDLYYCIEVLCYCASRLLI
jgi:hypothetical protein